MSVVFVLSSKVVRALYVAVTKFAQPCTLRLFNTSFSSADTCACVKMEVSIAATPETLDDAQIHHEEECSAAVANCAR